VEVWRVIDVPRDQDRFLRRHASWFACDLLGSAADSSIFTESRGPYALVERGEAQV